MAAAIAAIALVAGCGGGSSDTSTVTVGKVTVQTGSLSNDEFAEKADEICKATRKEFSAAYEKFLTTHQGKPQSVLAKELVESIAMPEFEKEIDQISELGASEDYAREVGLYLSALEQRLEQGQSNPLGLISSTDTFKKAVLAARKAGLKGCAASLS